jgi:hypothetical protein
MFHKLDRNLLTKFLASPNWLQLALARFGAPLECRDVVRPEIRRPMSPDLGPGVIPQAD